MKIFYVLRHAREKKKYSIDKMKKIILNQNYANALKNDIIGAVKKEIEEEKKIY